MSIDLTTLFGDLGIVGGNNNATNQYEFYYGIEWNDGDITYNQYEFFQKTPQGNRYDFFQQYGGEEEFYNNIDDPNIYDYRSFYENASFFFPNPVVNDWILKLGYWDDNNYWVDTDVWNDIIVG